MARSLPLALLAALALSVGCGDGGSSAVRRVGTEVGDVPPPADGRLPSGDNFSLDPDDGPTLVVIYRGGYCGLCRERLRRLQRSLGEYRRAGYAVVALTAEPPESAAATTRSVGAEFPVVSVDSTTLRMWGVMVAGEPAPRPAAYLLDEDGVIHFRHRGRHAADHASDADLLASIRRRRAR